MGAHWDSDLKLPALAFIPVSLMFLISHIIYWVVLLRNEPFWDKTSPTVATNQSNTHAWLFTVNTTMPGAVTPGKGLVKYGFGVWGWCEWGNSREELQGDATCYGGGAWKIPDDAGPGSNVANLDLPKAITESLFPCGLLLIAPIIATMFCFSIHLFTFRIPVDDKRPKFWTSYGGIAKRWDASMGTRVLFSNILYCWPTYFIVLLLIVGGSLPVIICVEIAKSKYRGVKGIGYYAARGLGDKLVVAALIMDIVALGWIAVGGFWRKPREKLPSGVQAKWRGVKAT